MDTRHPPRHSRGPIRQAHPRSRHHRLADSATLLAGMALLGVLTIGTVMGAGAGGTSPSLAPALADLTVQAFPTTSPSAAARRPAPSAATEAADEAPTEALTVTPMPAPHQASGDPAPRVARPSAPVVAPEPSPGPRVARERAIARATLVVPRPVAAFLGDSYTTGWAGAGLGRRGWPAIVSAAHGWKTVNRAVAGTGFVNPGWTGQPIRTRVGSVLKARPGIVFVAGGHNDNRFDPRATGRAAAAVLQRLRHGLPDAVLVVIGPIWGNGTPPASVRGIRDELRKSAAAVGAVFVDPIRGGWFAGAAGRLILADGIHPSNAGHRRIAGKVLAALGALR